MVRAASSDTAAVRRAVTVGPSMISWRWPVATSKIVTSPWMVGRAVAALPGVKVMSLVIATCASLAGMQNRLPPCGKGITMRGGTCTLPSCSTASSSAARAFQGSSASVACGVNSPCMACTAEGAVGGTDITCMWLYTVGVCDGLGGLSGPCVKVWRVLLQSLALK
jgi:hypothetical protein